MNSIAIIWQLYRILISKKLWVYLRRLCYFQKRKYELVQRYIQIMFPEIRFKNNAWNRLWSSKGIKFFSMLTSNHDKELTCSVFCQPCQSMSSVMLKLHPLRVTKFLFYVGSFFFKLFSYIFSLANNDTSKMTCFISII